MPGATALRAVSADVALLPRLAAGLHGRVHSVFARVVNIEVDGGELITLASRGVDNAPDTVIADIAGFDGAGIECGGPFIAAATKVCVGPLEIALAGARGWTATLPAYPQDTAALRANLQFVAARLGHGGAPVAQPPTVGCDDFTRAATLELECRARRLLDALTLRDGDAALAAARAMVGLGAGLTPSGDDFLVGLVAALNVPGSPCHALRVIGHDVVATARSRTNAISFAALSHAACGRVRDSIAALLRAVIGATPQRVAPALERVLAIGSSSGREIATGMASGLALHLQG